MTPLFCVLIPIFGQQCPPGITTMRPAHAWKTISIEGKGACLTASRSVINLRHSQRQFLTFASRTKRLY